MTDRNKGLLSLAAIVAVFPWIPRWFQFAGLTEGEANFWTIIALVSACVVLVGSWLVELKYD